MSESFRFLSKIRAGELAHVVALGSSNTERRLPGMHWFDCFELACRAQVGRLLTCINSGWGGHTTLDLLERLERDCLRYTPDLVMITIGGNDCNPIKGISQEQYRENLKEIIRRIQAQGSEVVLQTYYSFDLERFDPVRGAAFLILMEEVRKIAAETGCSLLDHLKRWERLREACPKVYGRLMADAAHVNEAGNLLLGLDLLRHFGLEPNDTPYYREARALQALLDQLELAEEGE